MANYYGTGRSNYVRVTDQEKFNEICNTHGLTFISKKIDGETLVGFTCEDFEDGDIPCWGEEDEVTGEPIEIDPLTELSKLLLDDEVLIHQTVGNEKHRYISGYSIAINNKGKTVVINLNDIYKKAKKLGKNISLAEY